MAENASVSGPDLTVGVAASSLREGEPLLGQVAGESVMLVRSDGQVFATAASCTHYGGPLAEGLVEGRRVHCPWHHACFDLSTGLAAGPALRPITCYEVHTDQGLVRVGKKRDIPRPTAAMAPRSVVIIGAGAAGAACAESLRRLGHRGSVTLVGDEAPGPVDRPNLSKDYLAGQAPEEWIPLRDAEFYRAEQIELLLTDAASSIDPARRVVSLRSGRELAYDALLLATGSSPRRLDIPGADAPHVFTLRTLADSRAIIARAQAASRAVVIGSSFIGLEVAASLRKRNLEVDVVSPDSVPLGRVVGEKLGGYVRALHEQHGVRFHLGRKPARIEAARVLLDDGSELAADFVVFGVGVSPRVGLAQLAGLTLERGVQVDAFLRTSRPEIYAAGDIAAYPDARSGQRVRIEHWGAAERQGQAVARAMLGAGTPFHDVPFFWSAHYETTLSYVGHTEQWDHVHERGSLESGQYVSAFERAGKILAVVSVGDDRASLRAEVAMQAGDDAALDALMR